MTNFDFLKKLSIDELAAWLDEYLSFDGAPHMYWFDKNYCSKCESIECEYTEFPGRKIACAYCEVYNKCKFFPEKEEVPSRLETAKLWLESEVEDENM